jgi:cell division protein FtsW (lipid II flippase)
MSFDLSGDIFLFFFLKNLDFVLFVLLLLLPFASCVAGYCFGSSCTQRGKGKEKERKRQVAAGGVSPFLCFFFYFFRAMRKWQKCEDGNRGEFLAFRFP